MRASSSTPGSIDSTCVDRGVDEEATDTSTRINDSYAQFLETIHDPESDDADDDEEKLMMMRRRRPIIKWNATCLQSFLYPLAIAVYLIAGALIFRAIESEHGEGLKEINEMKRRSIFDDIMNKTNLSKIQLEEIFLTFTEMCRNNVLQNVTENNWDFLPSVMFVTSVVTTIGKKVIITQYTGK